MLYGGRSCKSCMYFFRRVTYEEITFFCSAPDRKGHCVEQTDCIKCRRSCRSCRFKVISYHKNFIFLLFRHAKTLEWRLKNTLRSVIIFFLENCHQQVIFSYLYQLDTIKSSKMICDNFKIIKKMSAYNLYPFNGCRYFFVTMKKSFIICAICDVQTALKDTARQPALKTTRVMTTRFRKTLFKEWFCKKI